MKAKNNTKTAEPQSLSTAGLDDHLLMQDRMMVRMWKAREAGKGVHLSADEVWMLMSNALGNWDIEESLTANVI
jgi:hypothetical protein